MTDLLTRSEYAAIAADLDLPKSPFIDGKFRPGTGTPFETLNPAKGETLATIAAANTWTSSGITYVLSKQILQSTSRRYIRTTTSLTL